MKTALKSLCAVLVVVLIIAAVFCFRQEQKDCCLCNSFRYHAPCLIDLKTGEITELDLYFPHETKVAELADPQPEMDTVSFFRFGAVTGIKQTHCKQVELTVPTTEITTSPALCPACRTQLDGFFTCRYVLADLYSADNKKLIPLHKALSTTLRCYTISAQQQKQGTLSIIINGTLDTGSP